MEILHVLLFFPVFFASLPDALISAQDTLSLCSPKCFGKPIPGDITLSYQWYLNDTLLPGENTSKILPASMENTL